MNVSKQAVVLSTRALSAPKTCPVAVTMANGPIPAKAQSEDQAYLGSCQPLTIAPRLREKLWLLVVTALSRSSEVLPVVNEG